jgi:phosphotransferase system enzyme I (PtsP)
VLTQLRAIVEQVNQAQSLDGALQILVQQICSSMGVDCCSVYQSDAEQRRHVLRASEGLAQQAIGQAAIGFDEGVVGLVARRGEPLNIADVQNHPSFKYVPEAEEDSFTSFLGTPLIHQRQVIGVLVVQQSKQRTFSDAEEAFLVTLGAHLATTLTSAEMKEVLSAPKKNLWRTPLQGVAGSTGVAVAMGYVNSPAVTLAQQTIERTRHIVDEQAELERAIADTRDEFHSIALRLGEQLPKDVVSIFDIYQHMLADTSLAGDIRRKVDQGYTACAALKLVSEDYIGQFELMADPYLRERAVDVRDLSQRLLGHLIRGRRHEQMPSGALILVADEVTATMLAEVPASQLKGIVSRRGAANSHAAILARAMGIPAILGLSVDISLLQGRRLIVDGYRGELFIEPDVVLVQEYKQLMRQEREVKALLEQDLEEPAISVDGTTVELFINAGLSAETDLGEGVADGVGLYRTEVPFLLQDRFPSEAEQYAIYREILDGFKNRPVCMRTLDVGGDKQLPYFPIVEENPFLGWRGIRLTLDHPEIFLVQARAMYRAAMDGGKLSIMLPMISNLQEVDESLRLLDQAWSEVVDEKTNKKRVVRPKTGVMLEVPSVLYILPELAKRVSFWSVGSNDLTQYMLAVDRNNVRVAGLYDTLNPAVVRALDLIAQQALIHQLPVSVCGEMAGEPLGAIVLLSFGYRCLSMSRFNVAKIKYLIRRVSIAELTALREPILAASSSEKVSEIICNYLENKQLLHLVVGSRKAG